MHSRTFDQSTIGREANYTVQCSRPRRRVRSLLPLRRPASRSVAAAGFTRLREAEITTIAATSQRYGRT
jgi:hypothetical protein